MNDKEIENLIKNYTQNYYTIGKKSIEGVSFKAWILDDIVNNEPELGWKILLKLINSTVDSKLLAFIAAGPLENFLNYHHEKYFDVIEESLRKYPKFRKCMTGVWPKSNFPIDKLNILKKYTLTVKDPL